MKKTNEIKKPPILFKKTQILMSKISKALDGDFITYWVSNNSRIADEDIIAFFEILKSKQQKKHLYLFIKSDGGSGEGSLRIVNLLRKYYDHFTAFVPLDCASAATMLALGADKIKMGPLAYLSAILKIVEGNNVQLFYQKDKDWHYRTEERRWVPMNDESSWRKNELKGEKLIESRFYVR